MSHNINEPLGRRSHEIRSIKISSLGLWDKSEDYGPAKCVVLYATVFGVKDDKDKPRPHDINWLRTKDRLRCPQGSIANHLVWLNDISKQEE